MRAQSSAPGWPTGSRSSRRRSGCPSSCRARRRARRRARSTGTQADGRGRSRCTRSGRRLDRAGGRRLPGDGRVHGGRLPGRRSRARLPRFTLGSGRRSPSWSGATASRTSAAPSAAFRCTSFRWPPARSTRSRSTKPTSPAAGSSFLPFCLVRSARAGDRWSRSGASTGSSTRSFIPRSTGSKSSLRYLLGRPAQDPPNAQACLHGFALAACPVRRRVPGPAAADGAAGHRRRVARWRPTSTTSAPPARTGSSPSRFAASTSSGWNGSARWLDRFGWTFDELPAYLLREIPYLANRGGEALRALVAACVLDHDDIATLALSIEGLEDASWHTPPIGRQDPRKLPPGLPDPVVNLRTLWHPVHRSKRPVDRPVRAAVLSRLRPGPAPADPRLSAPPSPRRPGLDQGRARPGRRRPLGRRSRPGCATCSCEPTSGATRSWSSGPSRRLTMLDLQHNCELVWNLGGYTRPEAGTGNSNSVPFHDNAQPTQVEPSLR